jgi:hypothetical protein
MQIKSTPEPRQEADQTVRLEIDTKDGSSSIRIGFTDQRLTAHGGLAVWTHFLREKGFRKKLGEHLPHQPTSPNAYDPVDIGLGFMGGILCGADKLSRVAWLQSDPAIHEVLGIESVASQSTFSRFFGVFNQNTSQSLGQLHGWALAGLPSRKEGYTLDMDSWALLHEDGHQQGVALGHTRLGVKPCHRPLVAALAEGKMIANFWLRSGNTACVNGVVGFLQNTLDQLPKHIRVGLVRADSGFQDEKLFSEMESRNLKYIVVAQFKRNIQMLCKHDDSKWEKTHIEGFEVEGFEVQEVYQEKIGRRLILIRQRIEERPDAGGKFLLEVPGYRFQALITNLPLSVSPLEVWFRYNGRADIENRIKELGDQFGIKGLCCEGFWATEAMYHLAVAAYNLCVLLQRRLGQLERIELNTLRWRLFSRAAVWSRAGGKPTLKLAVQGDEARDWWRQIIEKITGFPNCNAVESFSA